MRPSRVPMSHTFARTLRRAGALRFLGDRALADLALGGDARAADTLVARHEQALCRLVSALLGDGPVAAAVAAEALETARASALEGLPGDRPPRLALLGVAHDRITRRIAQSAVPGAHPGSGGPDSPARELARLPVAERSAMALTGTVGLSSADAALLLGTTPEHVDALVRGGEGDLTAFPPSTPECVDARAEEAASGALAAHASRCPSCAAFAVERSERRRLLASVAPVAAAAAAPRLPPSPTDAGLGSASVGRGVARVEMAVLGTVGLVIVSVGVTLGVVIGTQSGGDAPIPSAEDLRPRPLPDFPEVAEVERLRQVARVPRRSPSAGVVRVTVSIGTRRPRRAVRVIPRAPSPPRSSVPGRGGPGAGSPPPAPPPSRPVAPPSPPPPSAPVDVAVGSPAAPAQPAPSPPPPSPSPPPAPPAPSPVTAPTTGPTPPSTAPSRKRYPGRRHRVPVVTAPPSWVPGPPPTTPPPHVNDDDDQHEDRGDGDCDQDRPRGRHRGYGHDGYSHDDGQDGGYKPDGGYSHDDGRGEGYPGHGSDYGGGKY